jgi:hypothetical protein
MGLVVGETARKDDFATASRAEMLYQLFNNADNNNIEANIAFMEPYAAPFSPYLVQAGEQAVDQFLGPLQNQSAAPAGASPADASDC